MTLITVQKEHLANFRLNKFLTLHDIGVGGKFASHDFTAWIRQAVTDAVAATRETNDDHGIQVFDNSPRGSISDHDKFDGYLDSYEKLLDHPETEKEDA